MPRARRVASQTHPNVRLYAPGRAGRGSSAVGPCGPTATDAITFVPVPLSKAKSDPLHDDRLTQMLKLVAPDLHLDIREMVLQPCSTDPVHASDARPSPDELQGRYVLDTNLLVPKPHKIAIVDDLLTTGAHFRAMKAILTTQFPTVHMIGLFIARRVPTFADVEEFEI